MRSSCILTDQLAQFPQFGFAGKEDVHIIPYDVHYRGAVHYEGADLKIAELPSIIRAQDQLRLIPPGVDDFVEFFTTLGANYRNVFVILTSSILSPLAFANAQKATNAVRGRVNVSLIDSQSISIGLGLLVQEAAVAIAEGMSAVDTERFIRSVIPQIYWLFYIPEISYLSNARLITPAQAAAGEILGITPLFTLEEGLLSPAEKVKNLRALVDYMQEFLLEFENLQHIAFLQSQPALAHEARLMREHAQSAFEATTFSELNVSAFTAALFGPRAVGLLAMEKPDRALSNF